MQKDKDNELNFKMQFPSTGPYVLISIAPLGSGQKNKKTQQIYAPVVKSTK